jgi:starch phosphorylase
MKPIRTFTVTPCLPARLERLRDLAFNLRWAWDHETIELFRRLDQELWEQSDHNPVLMLGRINQDRLVGAAADDGFLAQFDRTCQRLDEYLWTERPWYSQSHGGTDLACIAYFSAEFGLTECLPIYSGGLGLLAGDYLKSASDLGLPLVGIGLLYQQGYFSQYLNADGWQQESYHDNDFHTLPLVPERRADGAAVTVHIDYPGRTVVAQIWRAQVGRVPLYLLDTNVPTNDRADQGMTDQLYGGDQEMRIQQEILLGIGGMRALAALGLRPTVCHMNEGHSAFSALERIRMLMSQGGLSSWEAREAAAAGTVFTTHTPVQAGNDYFSPELIEKYLGTYSQALGLSLQEFLGLGRQDPGNDREPFCMTILALHLASHSNGVSKLHGSVARRMWQGVWPGVPVDEIPITSITNGVHFRSWISYELDLLYDRYLGPRPREAPADQSVWKRMERIPLEELWRVHERRRERMVAFVRRRLRAQLERRGAPAWELLAADEALDPRALTIGFARRFATYKRATLVLRDSERLARILADPQRPVQIIFAGKAHPRDDPGKELIRQIIHHARRDEFQRRLVFLEDYDMMVARSLVQGVDVWLNTPHRFLEASGTSGMKAGANGALNLSVLDGWWDEAYSPEIGWAIGRGEIYEDPSEQDRVESEALYDLLEKEVAPMFYERGRDGLPRRWVALMKTAMAALCPTFNMHRAVREYTEQSYLPAAERYAALTAEGMTRARALAAWRARVRQHWSAVRVLGVESPAPDTLRVGDAVEVRVRLHLGALTPEDVVVELYLGRVDPKNQIVNAQSTTMERVEAVQDGEHLFVVSVVPSLQSGLHGYTIRVIPRHPDLANRYERGLVVWATL